MSLEQEDDDEAYMYMLSEYAASLSVYLSIDTLDNDNLATKLGSSNVRRERVPVEIIFSRLGTRLFRKCYRMSEPVFWDLHKLLEPHLLSFNNNLERRSIPPNGEISTTARLSMALRWFAGGESADIFQVHRVGYNEVYRSVWHGVCHLFL